MDCCGLVICVAKELGLTDYDIEGYPRLPDGVTLLAEFTKICGNPIPHPEPGDIGIFRIRRSPTHCAILGAGSIIHACQSQGAVIEHSLDSWWEERMIAAFSFPGLSGKFTR